MEQFIQKIKGSMHSLTIWFNTTGITILTIASQEPLLHTWLVSHNFMWVLIIGNIFLRFKTDKALDEKGKDIV